MEKNIIFMTELGLLYDKEVQKPNNKENERIIYYAAKLFLDSKGIKVSELKSAMYAQEYTHKYENMSYLIGLLAYMEWKEKQTTKN